MAMEAVLIEQTPQGGGRRSERRRLYLRARSASQSAGEVEVLIHNISETGLLIEASADILSPGETIVVEIPERGPVGLRVVWKGDRYLGCEFEEPLSKAAISAALLRGIPVTPASLTLSSAASPRIKRGLGPELNFSVAAGVAIAAWVVIAAVAVVAFG